MNNANDMNQMLNYWLIVPTHINSHINARLTEINIYSIAFVRAETETELLELVCQDKGTQDKVGLKKAKLYYPKVMDGYYHLCNVIFH